MKRYYGIENLNNGVTKFCTTMEQKEKIVTALKNKGIETRVFIKYIN